MTEAPPGEPAGRAAPSWRASLAALLRADVAVQARNGRSLVLSLWLPIILLIALFAGKRTAQLGDPRLRVGVCITVGLASLAIMGYAVAVARDRDHGVFQRLRVAPVSGTTIMLSRLIVQVLAVVVMSIIVLIAAYLIDGVSLTAGGYVLTVAVLIVGAAVFLSIGQALVAVIRSAETMNAASRLLFVPLIGLSVFGHSDLLGATFEMVSRWSPGGALASLLSGAMAVGSWSSETWLALLACAGYTAVFAVIGIRWFRWS